MNALPFQNLSILFMRFGSRMPMSQSSLRALSILFMRFWKRLAQRKYYRNASLSILFMRFRLLSLVGPLPETLPFNSLYEIPWSWLNLDTLSISSPFNSLYEIRHCRSAGTGLPRRPFLSILFMRFGGLAIVVVKPFIRNLSILFMRFSEPRVRKIDDS